MADTAPRAHFVLIPSPLCGPATWEAVAAALTERGAIVTIPVLSDGDPEQPYWRQHTASAAATLADLPPAVRPILVAHSSAGPHLPAIHQALDRPVGGYLFVDAGLPHPGQSRLDELAQAVPDLANLLRADLEAGGRYPAWDDGSLRALIPDPARRATTLAELRPRPLAFFTEQLPNIAGWPDAPCAYLQFSAAYDTHAAAACALGWPTRAFDAGHFHQLVDPQGVAEALLALVAATGMKIGVQGGDRCAS